MAKITGWRSHSGRLRKAISAQKRFIRDSLNASAERQNFDILNIKGQRLRGMTATTKVSVEEGPCFNVNRGSYDFNFSITNGDQTIDLSGNERNLKLRSLDLRTGMDGLDIGSLKFRQSELDYGDNDAVAIARSLQKVIIDTAQCINAARVQEKQLLRGLSGSVQQLACQKGSHLFSENYYRCYSEKIHLIEVVPKSEKIFSFQGHLCFDLVMVGSGVQVQQPNTKLRLDIGTRDRQIILRIIDHNLERLNAAHRDCKKQASLQAAFLALKNICRDSLETNLPEIFFDDV